MNARTWLTLFASLALLTGPLGCPSFGSGDDDDDTTTGDDDTHSDDDVSDDDVTQMDEDNDGYTIDEGDCDDGDPDIHPGAVEYCYDERDNDCDGQVDVDDVQSCALNTEEFVVEGDGATLTVPPEAVYGETGLALGIVELAVDPPTGAEFASELYAVTPYGVDFLVPAQLELPYDDTAGDTFQMVMLEDEDDDTWEVVPEARGALPMYIGYPPLVGIFGIVVNTEDSDWDGDGYNEIEGDCDDFDADIHPGADEADNGIDDDCDELIDEDFVSHGDIIVTEFLDYPIQVEDEDQEWLELYNTTATDIDLSGWWVYEAYRGDTFQVDQSVVVPAGGYALLSTSADPTLNGNLPPVDYEYVWDDVYGIWPTGPERELVLYVIDADFTLVVEELWFLEFDPWPIGDGFSAYLDPDQFDALLNDNPNHWCHDDTNLYHTSPDLHGTPGAANPTGACCTDLDGDGYTRCGGDCDDGSAMIRPGAIEQPNGVDDDCDGYVDEDFIAAGDILITEFMTDPVLALDYEGQWIEVHNPTGSDINLVGWELSNPLHLDSHTILGDVVVPAGGYALLAVSAWTPSNGHLPPVDYEWSRYDFFFWHDEEEIVLKRGLLEVDRVLFQESDPWPFVPGTSVFLDPTRYDVDLNDDPVSWCSDESSDYGGGPGDYGTPGAANPVGVCCPDDDADGFTTCDGDCDDADPGLNPLDADGDGDSTCDGDCNDNDPAMNVSDVDQDGFTSCGSGPTYDCDDTDATVYPGAPELCDGIDNDCDPLGSIDEGTDDDDDGDTYTECQGDCDDTDATVCPDQTLCPELCDGLDNDCNPLWTETGDADGDGYTVCDGDCDDMDSQVSLDDLDGDGFTTCDGDCDDADAAVNPGMLETCNGVDDDCDPATNEWVDDDGDGFIECGKGPDDTDCDDTDPTVYPYAPELCDGKDNDCDPATDENWDGDGDGASPCQGDCDDTDPALNPDDADGDSYSTCDGDCDDTEALVYPGAVPAGPDDCDTFPDTDCDGQLDEADGDLDGDGYSACDDDCDDGNADVYPGAPDLCDGVLDNDCDGNPDSMEADLDGDGYSTCDGDCQDAYDWVHPGAPEICDKVDNDCDGSIDEDNICLCSCPDDDVDGHQIDTCTDTNCPSPDDCDDTDPTVFPGSPDVCDGVDNDCDGTVDGDGDGDGSGVCDDCDDDDPAVFPGATEVHDLVDNDCDVLVDEDFLATGDIVVSEFMDACQLVGDEQGEWFELFNTTGFDIDLVGWTIRDDSYGNTMTVDASVVVPAGGHALLAADGDPAINGGLPPVDYVFDHGDFALASSEFGYTHDEIIVEAGALELDRVEYLNSAPWPEGAGYSAYLDPTRHDAGDNDSGYAWCLDDLHDYGGGPGDFGTPGADNPAGICCVDDDGDGVSTCDGDCDDGDPDNYPGNAEVCDQQDNDCDGTVDEDGDGDGADVCVDCDDDDSAVFPGAAEAQDLVDNDCDGLVDEDFIQAGDILITELHRDPSVGNLGEWFELHNTTATDINLVDWWLKEIWGGDLHQIATDLVVPAGGTVLLAANADPALNGGLPPVDYQYPLADFELSATSDDSIRLYLNHGMPALTVDEVEFTNVDPWPVGTGTATYLDPTRYGRFHNDDPYSWCLDTSNDYGGGPGDYGTPGAANPAGACCLDQDGDGIGHCDGDCDDTDPANFPGNPEVCDGQDNDCNGFVDDGIMFQNWFHDGDLDGHGDPAIEQWTCDGPPGVDWAPDGDDCDDADPANFPGNPEICDKQDNDCDNLVDEGGACTCSCADGDADGYVPDSCTDPSCKLTGDCDDADPTIHPGATEACNGVDDDCSGAPGADEADDDTDGHMICEDDCDDTDGAVYPGATEVCNGVDDDCDGDVDDDDPGITGQTTWYHDADGDAYTDVQDTLVACDDPDGAGIHWVDTATADDCDDGNAAVNPGAAETTCDGIDQDCDGLADDDPNVDGDPVTSCNGDCNDNDPTIYPGATETTCDGIDQDCDGLGDDDPNVDGDPVSSCNGDCNDNDPTIYPGATETTCDGIDQDCDGLGDDDPNADGDAVSLCAGDCNDNDPTIFPGAPETLCDGIDQDCDGLGDDDPNVDGDPVTSCNGDCDDNDPDNYPGNQEDCDGQDNDCSGAPDPDEVDGDGDGYMVCENDCDDANPNINPGESETCANGIDEDCDGTPDDGCSVVTHCGTITADEVWGVADLHHITCPVEINGPQGTTVTIEDGAAVVFDAGTFIRAGNSNYGILDVQGTTAGVTFTSSSGTPAAGDWVGLILERNSEGSALVGATVAYAGGVSPEGVDAGIYLYSTTVPFDGCAVTDSAADGMVAQGSIVDFTGGILGADADLGPDGGNAGHGLLAEGSTVSVANARIDHNGGDGLRTTTGSILVLTDSTARHNGGDGVALDASCDLDPDASPSFENNDLTDNAGHPFVVPAGAAGDMDAGSTLQPNGLDSIRVLTGTITRSGTWHDHGVPWFVDGDVELNGPQNTTVAITDGNRLEFAADRFFRVGNSNYGILDVQGTTTGVTFTSDALTPAAGDWVGLILERNSEGSALVGTTVEYAGGASPEGVDAGIYLYSTTVPLDDCAVTDSAADGMVVQSSTVDFHGGDVDGNTGHGLRSEVSTVTVTSSSMDGNGDDGLHATTGSILVLTGSTALGNGGDGVALDASCDLDPNAAPSFQSNTITGNAGYPIVLPAGAAGDLDAGSTLQPNGLDPIRVLDGTITRSGTWHDHGVPWFVDGDVELNGPQGTTVAITDGNELRFAADRFFRVGNSNYGILDVQGTTTGVTFTSDAVTPAEGDWVGLILERNSEGSALVGTTVEYAGGASPESIDAGIFLYSTTVPFDDCEVSGSAATGLYASSSTVDFTGSGLGGHLDDNLGSGLAAANATVTVADTTLDRNGDAGNGGDGLTAVGSILTLTDLAVRDNDGDGVEMDAACDLDPGAVESFARNTITGNGGFPVVLPAGAAGDLDDPDIMGNSVLEPNGATCPTCDRIRVLDGTITRSGTWWNFDVPWYIDGDVEINGPQNTTVAITDGNRLEFAADRFFRVGNSNYGILDVQGTTTGVTFTSDALTPAAGDWVGLILERNSEGSALVGTTVAYAGGASPEGVDAGIYLYSTTVPFDGCAVTDSSADGMVAQSSIVDFHGGDVDGNTGHGLRSEVSTVTVTNSSMDGNGDDGLHATTGSILVMTGSTALGNGGDGVALDASCDLDPNAAPSFQSNTITGNAGYPIVLPAGAAGDLDAGSTLQPNGLDPIRVLDGTITRSGTWRNYGVPWFVDGDVELNGPQGTTVAITDGNVLRFAADRFFRVGNSNYGILDVQGATTGVTFTSDAVTPAAGDWVGLILERNSEGSALVGTTVAYAGGASPEGVNAGVYLYSTTVPFDDCAVTDSAADGMVAQGSNVDFAGGDLDGNAGRGLLSNNATVTVTSSSMDGNGDDGLHATGTTLVLTGSTALGNGDDGVELDAGSDLDPNAAPSFQNNTITGNTGYPIVLPAGAAGDLDAGSTLQPNGLDRIRVLDGTITRSGTWHDHGVPWFVDGDVELNGPQFTTVAIADGNELRFAADRRFRVGNSNYGILDVQGTSTGVTFTSDAALPDRGDWYGLVLANNAEGSTLTGVTVEYGGGNGSDGNLVFINVATASVTNSHFQHSLAWGIHRTSSTPTLTTITYANNALGDLF